MTPPRVKLKVSKGIPHAYKSVETFAPAVFLHAFIQSQPISFLNNWKEEKSTNLQFDFNFGSFLTFPVGF